MWSVVFISTEPQGRLKDGMPEGEGMIGVFLPCSPNPTTGFFFYLPMSDVVEIDLTPDEAAKLVMSAGLIQPEGPSGRTLPLANPKRLHAPRQPALSSRTASSRSKR
jgi:uncharacterized membrane protein